jgi:hypothetical protein
MPLPGATIIEKGSAMNATTTNLNGEFTLTVSGEQAILVISLYRDENTGSDGKCRKSSIADYYGNRQL